MGTALAKRLVQSRFESPVQVAILNLLVAASYLQEQNERLLAEHNLSPAQYNVLRILKGVHPEGHPRCEIARRMIERAPDLTRMIDGLERRGLVERARSTTIAATRSPASPAAASTSSNAPRPPPRRSTACSRAG